MATPTTALNRWKRRDNLRTKRYGMRVDDSTRKLAQLKRRKSER